MALRRALEEGGDALGAERIPLLRFLVLPGAQHLLVQPGGVRRYACHGSAGAGRRTTAGIAIADQVGLTIGQRLEAGLLIDGHLRNIAGLARASQPAAQADQQQRLADVRAITDQRRYPTSGPSWKPANSKTTPAPASPSGWRSSSAAWPATLVYTRPQQMRAVSGPCQRHAGETCHYHRTEAVARARDLGVIP